MALDPTIVHELFLEVFELPPDEREWRLIAVTAGKPELRAAVEELLTHHDEPDERADQLDAHADLPKGPQHPDRIGDYRVLGVLGSGSAGVVYRAEHRSGKRVVALKVLVSRFLSEDPARRLRREARYLAELQHEGIARVYDVGTFDDGQGGQPFFAMELVEGEPLTEFAAKHELDVRAKVALLIKICAAVHHAHEHRIVHRDLKPANILVKQSTGGPRPKVLDFGVARTVGENAEWEAARTRTGQLVGTLAYMSPEQITGSSRLLTERSDVYALGVVAYELLAGQRPYAGRGRGLTELTRLILEEPPTPLGDVDADLSGDLAAIVHLAMARDPEQRYESAAHLAADFQRFLDGDKPDAASQAGVGGWLRSLGRRLSGG